MSGNKKTKNIDFADELKTVLVACILHRFDERGRYST